MRISKTLLPAALAAATALPAAAQVQLGGPSPDPLQPLVNELLGLEASQLVDVALDLASDGSVTAVLERQGEATTMALVPTTLRAPGFQLLVQGEDGRLTPHASAPAATYRGVMPELAGSSVAASLLDDGLYGRVQTADGQVSWIQPLGLLVPGAAPGQHVLYDGDDVLEDGSRCASELLAQPTALPKGGDEPPTYAMTGLHVAELACDADYEYFLDYGTVGAVQNRIEAVINTVNQQYEAEVEITHEITTIIVRTSSNDPYSSTDAVTLLNQFRNEWNANQGGVQRDVAELFTGKEINGGTIGIAWVGAVCVQSYAYNMVQSDFNGAFACATDLTAHELGHNWGADHCNCTSYTMNPYITCANTFSPSLTVPDIVGYRDSVGCLEQGGGTGGGDPTSLHVGSITPGLVGIGKGKKVGQAVVTVVDDLGGAVSGAVVQVTFSGDLNQTVVGSTNGSGSVTLTTSVSKKGKVKYTVCVDSVSGPLPYAPGDNAETCDNN